MTALGVEPASARTVQLRVMHWTMRGGPPEAPLYLRTRTGRLYRVHTVHRTRSGSEARYTFGACRILPHELPADARVHDWVWTLGARRNAASARQVAA